MSTKLPTKSVEDYTSDELSLLERLALNYIQIAQMDMGQKVADKLVPGFMNPGSNPLSRTFTDKSYIQNEKLVVASTKVSVANAIGHHWGNTIVLTYMVEIPYVLRTFLCAFEKGLFPHLIAEEYLPAP